MCCIVNTTVFAKPIHVAFLGASHGENPYWDNVLSPLPEVAKQLGIKLTFHKADFNDRFDYYPKVKQLLESANKPDYLISVFRGSSARHLLELIELHKVPFISIATGVPLFEKEKVGLPQQYYKYWLAQILSNDVESGYLLANKLIEESRKKNPSKKIRVLAMGGGRVLASSSSRDQGLLAAIKEHKNVEFLQLVHSDWNTDKAKRMVSKLMKRHDQVDVFWAANDDIAIAIYEQLTLLNYNDNTMPIIGGVDWTPHGLNAVINNKISISLGSNHLHGVWALVMLHDIAKGYALHKNEQTYITPFIVADKLNIQEVTGFMKKQSWNSVNIKQFSKAYNSDIAHYDFDFRTLLPLQNLNTTISPSRDESP